ncbi:hypothetical protein EDEG_03665 [Edhazardia aedis USNM 41457]|uniref:Uncharacterized protein n=1 Tax=Edhazardia aedis (strain USNM 41457) TaxID=1003232 RepID=J9D1X7_EDHAE|nr:hypothetical protein EDEG_03665 [Edhazardia aedis USNM 41457]|eukprot:EJW01866.1 hypothetical protein EDEG_03665 [Edhazardia aedis USNM 41457]
MLITDYKLDIGNGEKMLNPSLLKNKMKTLILNKLKKIIASHIEGIDINKLEVGILSGTLKFENCRLTINKQLVMHFFKLSGLHLHYAEASKIVVEFNALQFFTSPITLYADGLNVFVSNGQDLCKNSNFVDMLGESIRQSCIEIEKVKGESFFDDWYEKIIFRGSKIQFVFVDSPFPIDTNLQKDFIDEVFDKKCCDGSTAIDFDEKCGVNGINCGGNDDGSEFRVNSLSPGKTLDSRENSEYVNGVNVKEKERYNFYENRNFYSDVSLNKYLNVNMDLEVGNQKVNVKDQKSEESKNSNKIGVNCEEKKYSDDDNSKDEHLCVDNIKAATKKNLCDLIKDRYTLFVDKITSSNEIISSKRSKLYKIEGLSFLRNNKYIISPQDIHIHLMNEKDSALQINLSTDTFSTHITENSIHLILNLCKYFKNKEKLLKKIKFDLENVVNSVEFFQCMMKSEEKNISWDDICDLAKNNRQDFVEHCLNAIKKIRKKRSLIKNVKKSENSTIEDKFTVNNNKNSENKNFLSFEDKSTEEIAEKLLTIEKYRKLYKRFTESSLSVAEQKEIESLESKLAVKEINFHRKEVIKENSLKPKKKFFFLQQTVKRRRKKNHFR